jgi:hypothetical protein
VHYLALKAASRIPKDVLISVNAHAYLSRCSDRGTTPKGWSRVVSNLPSAASANDSLVVNPQHAMRPRLIVYWKLTRLQAHLALEETETAL